MLAGPPQLNGIRTLERINNTPCSSMRCVLIKIFAFCLAPTIETYFPTASLIHRETDTRGGGEAYSEDSDIYSLIISSFLDSLNLGIIRPSRQQCLSDGSILFGGELLFTVRYV